MENTSNKSHPDELILRPIESPSKSFYYFVAILIGIIIFAGFTYIKQIFRGLGVTGMAQPVTWGFYIINFVFFIGISHAGTLISAILRLSKAEWRRPITRMAEVITAIVLAIGGLHPILDLGRPDRMLHLFYYGRVQSPLLWDITSITAYFTASTVYLFLPLIPDIAILRDRGAKPKWLYEFLSWGWTGTEAQHRVQEKAMNLLMVMVIPIAVSVHTIIAFIFAMTVQPGWHSTIFGPYFVAGALFSGIAAILVLMILFRKIFHLEPYLKLIHFKNLSILLLIMSIVWFYFTFSDYLTVFYGREPNEMRVFWYKFSGKFAPFFWTMVFCNFVLPMILLSNKKLRTIPGILIASISVIIGMWLERLVIVVPSLANPRLAYPTGIYIPTLTEWSVFAGGIATFILGFMVFARFFPVISIWEIEEGRRESAKVVAERITSYMPDPIPGGS